MWPWHTTTSWIRHWCQDICSHFLWSVAVCMIFCHWDGLQRVGQSQLIAQKAHVQLYVIQITLFGDIEIPGFVDIHSLNRKVFSCICAIMDVPAVFNRCLSSLQGCTWVGRRLDSQSYLAEGGGKLIESCVTPSHWYSHLFPSTSFLAIYVRTGGPCTQILIHTHAVCLSPCMCVDCTALADRSPQYYNS